ncbi:MAG: hypothetical protein HUJ56_03740, partial [Erysipelotrichaceae bacterium]|nr:hypothetical protein [Erysipelotrichaceae bacterium]
MNNYTWKERLQYWFDEKMAKGPSALIYLLGVVTVVMVLLLACVYAGIEGETFSSSLWNSFASTVNAWVAYYEDGSPVYLIVMSLAGIGGLFITSMLIGILTASIEEKMGQLRKGNSRVIESSHWVILGSVEHSILLIEELIMSLGDEKKTLVFACEGEKDELEDQIKSKIDIPDNIKFVVRSVDTKDSDQLECLSLNDAQKIIINEEDDFETLKCLLAVNNVLSEGDSEAKIVTYIKHMENDA